MTSIAVSHGQFGNFLGDEWFLLFVKSNVSFQSRPGDRSLYVEDSLPSVLVGSNSGGRASFWAGHPFSITCLRELKARSAAVQVG